MCGEVAAPPCERSVAVAVRSPWPRPSAMAAGATVFTARLAAGLVRAARDPFLDGGSAVANVPRPHRDVRRRVRVPLPAPDLQRHGRQADTRGGRLSCQQLIRWNGCTSMCGVVWCHSPNVCTRLATHPDSARSFFCRSPYPSPWPSGRINSRQSVSISTPTVEIANAASTAGSSSASSRSSAARYGSAST